ncbi:hypothetical protein LQ564_19110 [Massilia sp. G4R7]|uniref:Uncharacterized protein n=1 Tax=Massilia phyllostachyos TaxID=2898585 RepID=A0ABS8Q9I6_9BURK|nr:hypothetical protein [Massilia phyllostachyos]MCD2518414.1 hypothetical protein [Massilia phyllostachyos]
MSDPTNVSAQTNTTSSSRVTIDCNCNTMWSLAHQFSTIRLCTQTGERRGKLVRDYAVRARRISASYARFYLEIEDGGSPEKKGRYYWMALGAFASKTVACTFDAWQVKRMTHVDSTVWEGLGKGNFWLFFDISGWHWYRNMYPSSFTQCLKSRNTDQLVGKIKSQLSYLPWSKEALPIINNLRVSNEIIAGFEEVTKYEQAAPPRRADIQFKHLLAIANHEQGIILQPLIYKNESFAARIRFQRNLLVNWATPPIELVFHHSCSIEDGTLKSVAPDGTELENLEMRMAWIVSAAGMFHTLMQRKNSYMENELRTMAGWVDMPDSKTFAEKAKEVGEKLNSSIRSAVEAIR